MTGEPPNGVTTTIRVLHVDDAPDFADTAARFLEHEDDRITVLTATDAAAGLSALANNEVDCIVSDYEMPGRNGIEFLEAVREDHPDLPFVLYTGKGSEEVASDAISAGVTDYLQKKGGTHQYTVLANRIMNAVESHRSRRELEASRDRLSLFIEESPLGVLEYDGEFNIVRVNPAAEAILGYSESELRGETWEKLVTESSYENVDEVTSALAAKEGGYHSVDENVRGDGERIVCEWHNRIVTDDDGDVVTVFSLFQDVTERRDRIREIRDLTERLELAVEGANLGVWDWDMTTDAVEFNDRWATMLGYAPAEIDPRLEAWEKRVHPDDIDDVEAALDAHIDEETPYYGTEHRMRTADGDWRWIRDIGRVVERDDAGDPVRAVGIHIDIDERKRHERKLERKATELETATTRLEEQYRTLFEEAPVMAVITRTVDGRPTVDDYNEQFIDTLGYDPEAISGAELAEFYTAESTDRLLADDGYTRALDGDFTRQRRELLTADGDVVETLLRAVPHRDESGEVVGTLAMYVDITERERTKRTNERLEEFTHVVSHDLRNPLNVATGRLDLAREECDSDHLDDVARAHNRMIDLIDDLLTLAREGDRIGSTEPVDLGDVVADCWGNVTTDDATVSMDVDRTIRADPARLPQLFENLIRNSVEHGSTSGRSRSDDAAGHGSESVTVTVGELEDGFYVEDDGTGIPEDDRDRAFVAGHSTSERGTGFGLSIVDGIVEAHGWEVRLTEGSEGGARFEITGVETVDG